MTTTDDHAGVTYFHWLFWKLKCHEAGGMEFQKLFESVAERAGDEFIRVKPYGNKGDKKADGLYFRDGVVYQVYSPDRVKLADTLNKIIADLDGAIEEWGEDLEEWTFVYNTRWGTAADIPALLKEKTKEYPDIAITTLGEADLWKIVRDLSAEDRMEILGPPPTFADLQSLEMVFPEPMRARHEDGGRLMIVQDVLAPIDVHDAATAMLPARPLAPPLFLSVDPDDVGWSEAADRQAEDVRELLGASHSLSPAFAVFSLAPISLAVHLGFLLSDRVSVEPYQFDRRKGRATWSWPADTREPGGSDIQVNGVPAQSIADTRDIVMRVSLSAAIDREDTVAAVGAQAVEIDVRVAEPNVLWLQGSDQLVRFEAIMRDVVGKLLVVAPAADRIHLFYSGPTGPAVALGQIFNPRMHPRVLLYEYDHREQPRYRHALTLT